MKKLASSKLGVKPEQMQCDATSYAPRVGLYMPK